MGDSIEGATVRRLSRQASDRIAPHMNTLFKFSRETHFLSDAFALVPVVQHEDHHLVPPPQVSQSIRFQNDQAVGGPCSTSGCPWTSGENTASPSRISLAVAAHASRNRCSRTADAGSESRLVKMDHDRPLLDNRWWADFAS